MKILVVGGGGREHAIIRAAEKKPAAAPRSDALPGNGGISYDAVCVAIPATDVDAIVGLCQRGSL